MFLKKVTAAIMAIDLPGTNLTFYGTGLDTNGNKVAKLGFPNQPKFSIQTNGNMPKTHSMLIGYTGTPIDNLKIIKKEAVDYIKNYGSAQQKASLKEYSEVSDVNATAATPQHPFTRENMIKRIIKDRMEEASDNYWEDILRYGYTGIEDMSDAELESEIKGMMDNEDFEGTINEFLKSEAAVNATAAKKTPTSVPDRHKQKIACDTVRNPNKALLGGPSVEEAKKMLREHFGYSDKDLADLEVSASAKIAAHYLKADAADGYNFETPEEQVKELTRFYQDQGKWQENYHDNPDYAEGYDVLLGEINPANLSQHGSMGEEFKKIWDSLPKAHHKDAWQWVRENTEAKYVERGSPGQPQPNSALSISQGGEDELQISGVSGKVNRAETNDILKENELYCGK